MSCLVTSHSVAACRSDRGYTNIRASAFRKKAISYNTANLKSIRQTRQEKYPDLSIKASEAENGDAEEVEVVVGGGPSVIANNSAFAAVFKGALQRSGKDALTRNARPADEVKPSPAEEVLLQALRQSRRNLLRLEELKDNIEGAIEIETKQFERIQFSLKRATADAAFIRTLQKMRRQAKEESEE